MTKDGGMTDTAEPSSATRKPVNADPVTEHCSTVVLGPSTQYKQSTPAFILEERQQQNQEAEEKAVPLLFLVSRVKVMD